MRIDGILNAQLSRVLSELRHTDTLVVSDSGLPVPVDGPEVVDLAVVYGLPAFEPVLSAIVGEIVIEGAFASEQVTQANPAAWEVMRAKLGVEVELIPHEELKAAVFDARAVVRTGEATPYANVVLRCGVPFA